jgi:hypothetical protein
MTGHAILAPSGAHRRWKCPASRALEARLPEVEGPEAAEGTAAHEVAAHLLTTGELLPVGHVTSNGVPVDEAMRDGAEMYAQDILSRLDDTEAPSELMVEQHVKAHELIHPECEGTPDAVHISHARKRIRLWDYKYGHGYVEAHENPQLIEYLAGILESNFDYDTMDDQAWTFEATIVQPREYGRLGPVRRWCGYVSDLRALFNFAKDREARSMDRMAPTIAGPDQCKNCKAIATCEANQRYVSQLADYVAGNTPFDPPPFVVGAELTMLKRVESMLKARLAGLEAVAGAQISSGRTVPGWHFERGQSRLKWNKPPAEVIAAMSIIAGKDVSKADVITPTQAIKLGIDEAVILSYADRPPGELKLAPINYTQLKKAFSNG